MTNITNPHIVIIGAGYAGVMAALRLSHHSDQLAITVINASDQFNERIRLHQASTGQRLPKHDLKQILRHVTFKQGLVEAIQPEAKTLTMTVQGQPCQIAYDYLIYALGSRIDRHSVPGVDQHAYTVDQFAQIREVLRTQPGRILVVGGGLTGIETATEIAERTPGNRVTLITAGLLGVGLSKAGQNYLRNVFEQLRITVQENTQITRVEAKSAITDHGTCLPFDLCLWTAGFEVPSLAREAGLAVNNRGQVMVDSTLRSVSHSDIYAIGDSAALDPNIGIRLRMACATALPMGSYIADQIRAVIAGQAGTPFRFGYAIQCISLGRRRGLVQFVNTDDSPKERIITGKAGAEVKELICRYTMLSLSMERYHIGRYRWSQGIVGQQKAVPLQW